jgi:hypothetical protein
MSIDKKGFRYRLSNVLAWLGFGITVVTILIVIMEWRFTYDLLWMVIFALGFQGFLGTINYLMLGSFRLLPWRDIEDQE